MGAAAFLTAIFIHEYGIVLAFGVICLMSLIEYARLTRPRHNRGAFGVVGFATVFGFLLPVTQYIGEFAGEHNMFLLFAFSFGTVYLLDLLMDGALPNPKRITVTIIGIIWIALPVSLMVDIGLGDGFDPIRLIAILFPIWAADVGAYFAGSTFGRTKLAPKISPKKTWEGFIGGILLALAISWGLSAIWPGTYPRWIYLTLGAICAVFGVMGDLLESSFKRSRNIKDSGGLLPGHGGFLDRFDSLFVAAPASWFFLLFLEQLQ